MSAFAVELMTVSIFGGIPQRYEIQTETEDDQRRVDDYLLYNNKDFLQKIKMVFLL